MTRPWFTPARRLATSLHWALAALALVLVAGCFNFDDDVVLLDVGSSRIPLGLHGVWRQRISDTETRTVVIDSQDGRIGNLYQYDTKDGKTESLIHASMLAVPVAPGLYLVSRTGDKRWTGVLQLQRNTAQQLQLDNSDEKKDALAALAQSAGVTLDTTTVVKGQMTLATLAGFVTKAFEAGLFTGYGVPYERQHWQATDWQRFDTLRSRHDQAVASLSASLEQALRNPHPTQFGDQFKKIMKDARPEAVSDLKTTPEGALLMARATRQTMAAFIAQASADKSNKVADVLALQKQMDKMILGEELEARRQAAAYGHTESQLWLARHDESLGTDRIDTLSAALRWYELAAASGHAEGAAGVKRVGGRLAGMGLR